jgi:hypothetical protein
MEMKFSWTYTSTRDTGPATRKNIYMKKCPYAFEITLRQTKNLWRRELNTQENSHLKTGKWISLRYQTLLETSRIC